MGGFRSEWILLETNSEICSSPTMQWFRWLQISSPHSDEISRIIRVRFPIELILFTWAVIIVKRDRDGGRRGIAAFQWIGKQGISGQFAGWVFAVDRSIGTSGKNAVARSAPSQNVHHKDDHNEQVDQETNGQDVIPSGRVEHTLDQRFVVAITLSGRFLFQRSVPVTRRALGQHKNFRVKSRFSSQNKDWSI